MYFHYLSKVFIHVFNLYVKNNKLPHCLKCVEILYSCFDFTRHCLKPLLRRCFGSLVIQKN